MTQLAIDEQVDLVVIAGDLYDGDWKDTHTGLFFVGQATRLVNAGIPIVVIRGNHDAANVMTSSLPLPDNPDGSEIMMAADRVDCRMFEKLGISVHGRSFGKREETEGLAAQYPTPHRGMFNLGLLHTSLNGAEGHDPYAPCTPAQLTDKEYDYWALGHIHLRGEHGVDGGAPIVFSGNVQGRHIREAGAKGCVIVDVDSHNQTTRTFHELDVVRWELCNLDVTNIQHVDDVMDQFQQWLQSKLCEIGDRTLVTRVRLIGETDQHTNLHRQSRQIEASLRSMTITHGEGRTWLEKTAVRTTAPKSQASEAELQGPFQSMASVVDELRGSEELSEIIQKELGPLVRKLPVELLDRDSGFDFTDERVVRDLIESASADLQGRLQAEEVGQ